MSRRALSGKGPATPNILFVLSDDQGCWAMGCAGNQEIRTPGLDRLAATGVRFDNFFCASPVCSPARASILTGRIPSCHGVHDWLRAGNTVAVHEPERGGRLIEYLKGQPGYTDYLAGAGYVCGISGKWHLGDSHHAQKGFSFWDVHAKGGGPYYDAPMVRHGKVCRDRRYVTDVITDNALGFLERQKEGDAPFCLSVHYTAPHAPWERQHHPAELFDGYHDGCLFESVPDAIAPPDWVQRLTIPVNDAATRRVYLSGYFAAITAMDSNIGRLLDWLEATNMRQDTLVCFMSDNGMSMGHHGVYGKGNATVPLNMFEESVKVPCIISHPGRIPEGAVVSELLSQYDVMPTLLDYVGVDHPEAESLPGRSFAAALRGDDRAGQEYVVVFDEYGPVRMVRTGRWKYVHRYPEGPHELYDLRDDAAEQMNLIANRGHRQVADGLRARLENWFARYSDPARDGRSQPVTGAGQGALVGDEGAFF